MIRFRIVEIIADLESLQDLAMITRISGRECYYKRSIETGMRVYFRVPTNHDDKCTIDLDVTAAGYFRYYHVYTFDVTANPIEVDEQRVAA